MHWLWHQSIAIWKPPSLSIHAISTVSCHVNLFHASPFASRFSIYQFLIHRWTGYFPSFPQMWTQFSKAQACRRLFEEVLSGWSQGEETFVQLLTSACHDNLEHLVTIRVGSMQFLDGRSNRLPLSCSLEWHGTFFQVLKQHKSMQHDEWHL